LDRPLAWSRAAHRDLVDRRLRDCVWSHVPCGVLPVAFSGCSPHLICIQDVLLTARADSRMGSEQHVFGCGGKRDPLLKLDNGKKAYVSRSSSSPAFRWRRASHFSIIPVSGVVSSTHQYQTQPLEWSYLHALPLPGYSAHRSSGNPLPGTAGVTVVRRSHVSS